MLQLSYPPSSGVKPHKNNHFGPKGQKKQFSVATFVPHLGTFLGNPPPSTATLISKFSVAAFFPVFYSTRLVLQCPALVPKRGSRATFLALPRAPRCATQFSVAPNVLPDGTGICLVARGSCLTSGIVYETLDI